MITAATNTTIRYRCEIGQLSSDPCRATATALVRHGDRELHACARCAKECHSHGFDIQVGECAGCGEEVWESERSRDALEYDVTLHVACEVTRVVGVPDQPRLAG